MIHLPPGRLRTIYYVAEPLLLFWFLHSLLVVAALVAICSGIVNLISSRAMRAGGTSGRRLCVDGLTIAIFAGVVEFIAEFVESVRLHSAWPGARQVYWMVVTAIAVMGMVALFRVTLLLLSGLFSSSHQPHKRPR